MIRAAGRKIVKFLLSLLPEAPDAFEEGEYDSSSRLAFQVGRIATALSGLRHGVFRMSLVDAESTADAPDAP